MGNVNKGKVITEATAEAILDEMADYIVEQYLANGYSLVDLLDIRTIEKTKDEMKRMFIEYCEFHGIEKIIEETGESHSIEELKG